MRGSRATWPTPDQRSHLELGQDDDPEPGTDRDRERLGSRRASPSPSRQTIEGPSRRFRSSVNGSVSYLFHLLPGMSTFAVDRTVTLPGRRPLRAIPEGEEHPVRRGTKRSATRTEGRAGHRPGGLRHLDGRALRSRRGGDRHRADRDHRERDAERRGHRGDGRRDEPAERRDRDHGAQRRPDGSGAEPASPEPPPRSATADIQVGQYNPQTNTFTNGATPPDAVRATPSTTVQNLFVGIFGASFLNSTVTKTATAGFSGLGQAAGHPAAGDRGLRLRSAQSVHARSDVPPDAHPGTRHDQQHRLDQERQAVLPDGVWRLAHPSSASATSLDLQGGQGTNNR